MNALRRQGEHEDYWDEYEGRRSESSSDESNCDEPRTDESSSDEDNVVVEGSLVIENRRGDNTFGGLGESDGGRFKG